MRKQVEESVAAEGARWATGAVAERDRKGRFSARRKRETVLRLLRGEDLESVSRALGITAARAAQWRDQFLALLAFKRTYNEQWMLEKYDYRSPARVRRDLGGLDVAA